MKIVITGAAGLIGQNLIVRLKAARIGEYICIDKHPANTGKLAALHRDVTVIEADLAQLGEWQSAFKSADVLILNHAQIGGLSREAFIANNETATINVLSAAKQHGIPYIVHVSSSVVNSKANDHYTESKKIQEQLVLSSGIPACILRPTLMFGWFDRKHLGWLARFMKRVPIFPIPGNGLYLRQPLYAGDLCNIIIACVQRPRTGEIFNVSGLEKIDYIDMVRAIRDVIGSRTFIAPIPFSIFAFLLNTYALFDRNPPFTTKQLQALVIPEVFETIDWPQIFGVPSTPFRAAISETFHHPVYSKMDLEF